MDKQTFLISLKQNKPPAASPYLLALWHDARGQWEEAHHLIQDIEDQRAAWIHAYLHRKEGDESNAGYWYRRAGKQFPAVDLEKEWQDLVDAML